MCPIVFWPLFPSVLLSIVALFTCFEECVVPSLDSVLTKHAPGFLLNETLSHCCWDQAGLHRFANCIRTGHALLTSCASGFCSSDHGWEPGPAKHRGQETWCWWEVGTSSTRTKASVIGKSRSPRAWRRQGRQC